MYGCLVLDFRREPVLRPPTDGEPKTTVGECDIIRSWQRLRKISFTMGSGLWHHVVDAWSAHGIRKMETKYEIVVAHRVCPALSGSAVGFDSKEAMVSETAKSLFAALEGVKARVIVLLDGCPDSYESFFRSQTTKVTIERFAGIGNQKTFGRQLDILSQVQDSKYVYFSEDDYLYRKGAFREMLAFMRKTGADFVSPLDHPDRYLGQILESRETSLVVDGIRHWRQSGTTCLTFMARVDSLMAGRAAFETYVQGNIDGTMWLGLTKDRIFSFPTLLVNFIRHYILKNSSFGRVIPLAAWRWHGLKLLSRRKYQLWTPVPTLAVHLSRMSLPLGAGMFFSNSVDALNMNQIANAYLSSGSSGTNVQSRRTRSKTV